MKLKIFFLILILSSYLRGNDRFLGLIIQDGSSYWVTVQSTDANSGIIILDNGDRHENWQNEFLVSNVRHINYRIPRNSWGTQVVIRVYAKKPKINPSMFGAVIQNDPQNKPIAQANFIQADKDSKGNDSDWAINQINIDPITKKLSPYSVTIPDSNVDLTIRVMVAKNGTIHILPT